MGEIMDKVYQMSELEYNAFINHCKSSEIYRIGNIMKGSLDYEPQGEMAWDDWFKDDGRYSYEPIIYKNGKRYIVYETKEIKVKGYDNGKEKLWVK